MLSNKSALRFWYQTVAHSQIGEWRMSKCKQSAEVPSFRKSHQFIKDTLKALDSNFYVRSEG